MKGVSTSGTPHVYLCSKIINILPMYDDYDYLDYELESYQDEIDGYDNELNDLEDREFCIKDSYDTQTSEIDEYWDRENAYIVNSGIYTKEEIQQILENHEEIRRNKKEDARRDYETEKEFLDGEREHLKFMREMAVSDRDSVRHAKEMARVVRNTYVPHQYVAPQKSSFIKNTITVAAIFHFLKKLF